MQQHKHLAERIANMPESATLQMAQLAREFIAKGADVVNLALGEPDFDTPSHIRQAAKTAIDEGYTHYTPVSGYHDLREVICEKFLRDNDLHYSPEQIVVSTGAKQSLANVVLSLIDPGDEIILPVPYWVSYAAMIQLADGVPEPIQTTVENDFKITPQQLQDAIGPKSKLMIFSSPCNPSGSVYTAAELGALAEVIAAADGLYVISDEIYEHINFTGEHSSIGTFKGMDQRVITVNGLSKGFAMTGWRLGYIGAPLWIARACTKMQGQYTSGTSSISQRAAISALLGNRKSIDHMRVKFEKRRELVYGLLNQIAGLKVNMPQGAFYFFPSVKSFIGKARPDGRIINNADDLCIYLLEEYHLSLVSGTTFGDANCIRISYAASEQKLKEGMQRLKTALTALS